MKTDPKSRRASGFTLIELLVVITIIAALGALSFAGVQAAMRKAKKAQAEVAASALNEAIERFYGEYNRLPDLPRLALPTGGVTDTGDGVELLNILLAEEETEQDDIENPRQIRFLEMPEAKAKRNGLVYASGGGAASKAIGLYDPYGKPFRVLLNLDYDDQMEFRVGDKNYILRGKNVAIYSVGADGKEGTKDDVRTFKK